MLLLIAQQLLLVGIGMVGGTWYEKGTWRRFRDYSATRLTFAKALKLVQRAEKALGFALTERTAGGRDGGGSSLTAQGKEWLRQYERYRDACVEANRQLYLACFPQQR